MTSTPILPDLLPATEGMLRLVRTELKENISELRSEMKAEFMRTDARIQDVLTVSHGIAAEVARLGVLVEEQNSRNRIVLEALTGISRRQDQVEVRAMKMEARAMKMETRAQETDSLIQAMSKVILKN